MEHTGVWTEAMEVRTAVVGGAAEVDMEVEEVVDMIVVLIEEAEVD